MLAEIALSIPDAGSLVGLLPQLKGTRVQVRPVAAKSPTVGVLLGIDTVDTVGDHGTTQQVRVSILTDAADVLTYTENQSFTIELNGVAVGQHLFGRTNHKERLVAPLALRPGRNEVTLRYSQSLVTDYDPRKLAVIFLTLRILSDQTS